MHVHISRLSRASQHANDLRLATEAFLPLARRFEGQTYRLANNDLVFVGKDVTVAAMDEVVLRLRYMFRDDPLFKDVEQSGGDRFCTYYDMAQNYEAFLALTESLLEAEEAATAAPDSGIVPFAAAAKPALAAMPEPPRPTLADDVKAEDIFALGKDGHFAPILTEIYFRPESLRARHHQTMLSAASDGWLLTTLAHDLEPGFADTLAATQKSAAAKTLVLRLHPASLLLPEFDRFAEAYRQACRLPLLVELTAAEALREPETLIAGQARLGRAGFRLCLADWNPYAFAMFDARRIDAQFHKIAWQPQLMGGLREEWRQPIQDAIKTAGAAKVILTDCPTLDATVFAHRLGIALYAGAFPTAKAAR